MEPAQRVLRRGRAGPGRDVAPAAEAIQASCACASAIPVQTVDVAGQVVPLAALPLIFEQFRGAGKVPGAEVTKELLATVRIYNDVPAGADEAYAAALARAYAAFCGRVGSPS